MQTMATLADLRKKAKEMGIAAAVIRGASSANELQEIISDHSDNGNGSKGKKAAKNATKKAVAKKSTAKASKKGNSTATKSGGKNKNSKTASSKSAPAKSAKKGTAKRQATADGDAGRHMLGSIDYSQTEGWNPRDGSVPDRIHKALKKFRGNREKVFDHLVDSLWDFVPKKKQDGTKRTKDEAENLLKFRIAQTDWRFAIQTGQHEASENRAEYGSGGNSKPKAKEKAPAKRGRPAKAKVEDKPKRGRPAKKDDAPKRGRPKGSKNAPKAEAKRGRGRPKGSKNKK